MAYTTVKTPIVYYGGKTAMLPHIRPLIPIHEVYTECFFGGGTVFFDKEPVMNETINDKLDIVVNFYRTMKLRYLPLKKLIDATLISRTIHNEALGIIRRNKKGYPADKIKLAWAFWVCTNFAYSNKIGGGYKYSNHMSVSVPHTLKKRKEQFTEQMVSRIELAYIENDDALKVLRSRNVDKAFHYLDPPYPNADQGHYAGYGWDEYENLLSWCETECNGKFLLSSYNSEMLNAFIKKNRWYKKEITQRLQAPRKNKSEKTEVLVWNYNKKENEAQMQLFEKKEHKSLGAFA